MKKKIIVSILALSFIFSLAACETNAKQEEQKQGQSGRQYTSDYDKTKYNEPGTFPIFKEKQTITVMLPSTPYVEDWDTNHQTLITEEQLNADLKIEAIPSKEYKTKINLMTAAGGEDLADAIMGKFTDTQLNAYARSENIIPLTDYYYNTSIAYYLNQAKERIGVDFFPHVTAFDGEIYGIAHYNDSITNLYPVKMFIYKPWLDKLGIDPYTIVTPEDYKNLLIKIRDTDLNGNGLQDEIPNVQAASNDSWRSYLMNPFVYAGGANYMVVKNGKLSFAFQDEGWKEGLKYIKSLVDENLFSTLSLTQNYEANKALLNKPETVVGTFASEGIGSIDANDPRRKEYWVIGPLQGKDGKAVASYIPEVADIRMVISRNAKDPENTFRFGDLMVSEQLSIHTKYGGEGTGWVKAGPNDVSKYAFMGYKATRVSLLTWSSRQNEHWYQTGPYIRGRDVAGSFAIDENANEMSEQPQMEYEGKHPDEFITKLVYSDEESIFVDENMGTLISYVNEMTDNFITGIKDIDKDWDAFQDQIEAMKAEELIEVAQRAFDRVKF